MAKENEYRKNAAETMHLVQRVSSTEDKSRLLKLAEAWLDLADRARKIGHRVTRPSDLHPLVRDKLDRYVDEP